MLKPSIVFLLCASLLPVFFALQTAAVPASTCGDHYCNSHGWLRISTPTGEAYLSGFSPEISNGYASMGGAGLINGKEIEIQIDFLSRPEPTPVECQRWSLIFEKAKEGGAHFTSEELRSAVAQ